MQQVSVLSLIFYTCKMNKHMNKLTWIWNHMYVHWTEGCAYLTCVDDLSAQKRRSISKSPRATPVLRHSLASFLYIAEQEGFSNFWVERSSTQVMFAHWGKRRLWQFAVCCATIWGKILIEEIDSNQIVRLKKKRSRNRWLTLGNSG